MGRLRWSSAVLLTTPLDFRTCHLAALPRSILEATFGWKASETICISSGRREEQRPPAQGGVERGGGVALYSVDSGSGRTAPACEPAPHPAGRPGAQARARL